MNANVRVPFSWLTVAAGLWAVAGSVSAGPIEDLQPGHWLEIPNSRLSSVLPTPEPPGNTGFPSIMDTWNGGAYDSKRDRLIVWGGGHLDYAGNELYVFDMNTFQWTRLTNPSTAVGGSGPYFSDGQPRSRHTYEVQEYLPDPVDRFCAWGVSATYPSSGYHTNVDCFDFTANTWSFRTNVPSIDYGGITAYDADRGLLIHHATAQGRIGVYNWATDTWRSGPSNGEFVSYELTADYDPIRKELVGVGGGGSGPDVYIWNVANLNSLGQMQNLATTGHDNVVNILNPGVAWDPILKRIVIWGNGTSVYSLDRTTNTWQRHLPAPTNTVDPGQRASNGTFGRFRYMPRFNAYVVVNSINRNVFVYKLTANSGVVTPTVNLSANPASVLPQGSAQLTWSSTDADTCMASGGWSGSRNTSGTETVGPLASSTTYTLTCQNSTGGSAGRSVTVTVSSTSPTVDLTANPTTVPLNGTTQLMWTSSNATTCAASGGWNGSRAIQGSEQSGPIAAQTTFTLTCTGAGGSTPDSVTVSVMPPSAPTVSLSANPTSVSSGGMSTLTWSSTNATSCTASGGWSGTKATSGNQSVGPLTATATFTLNCSGGGGSAQRSVMVTVNAPPPPAAPTLSLSANPTSVSVNGASMLTWTSTNASSCTASGGWSGAKATSGSESTGALSNTTSYTLDCTGAGGSAQQTLTVTVTPGGGGGGSTSSDDSGGGAVDRYALAVLAITLLMLAARWRQTRLRPGGSPQRRGAP